MTQQHNGINQNTAEKAPGFHYDRIAQRYVMDDDLDLGKLLVIKEAGELMVVDRARFPYSRADVALWTDAEWLDFLDTFHDPISLPLRWSDRGQCLFEMVQKGAEFWDLDKEVGK